MDLQIDIHRSMDNWRLISIKSWISIYGYILSTDIHCGMSLQWYPCLDINVDIHACMNHWRHIQKSWISVLISVDFWKSMHGFAMDSRTRDVLHVAIPLRIVRCTEKYFLPQLTKDCVDFVSIPLSHISIRITQINHFIPGDSDGNTNIVVWAVCGLWFFQVPRA